MASTKQDMDAALKATVVPVLRAAGFKGSYPHFHRDLAGHVDLLTFQFGSAGGRFVVEIAFATASRDSLHPSRRDVPAAKLRVFHTGQRLRLGGVGLQDKWFIYAQPMTNFGEAAEAPDDIAHTIAALIPTEAETWWSRWRVGG